MKNKILILDVIVSLFILQLLYTGLIKTFDNHTFREALHKSSYMRSYEGLLSITVPAGELLTVICLLIPKFRKIGIWIFLVMMTCFTVYVGFMLMFDPDRPCTCGGIIQQMNWHQHLYFNSAFTILAGVALWLDKQIKNAVFQKKNHLSYL